MPLTLTAFSACAEVYSQYICSVNTVPVVCQITENIVDIFLKTYIQLCTPAGGPNWNIEGETAFAYHVVT